MKYPRVNIIIDIRMAHSAQSILWVKMCTFRASILSPLLLVESEEVALSPILIDEFNTAGAKFKM